MLFASSSNLLNGRYLAGFLLLGFLLSLLGALLPAWGYDISNNYAVAGRYFLATASGMIISAVAVRRLSQRLTTRRLLVSGCSAATLGLSGLAFAPDSVPLRAAALLAVGIAGGLLHSGLFEAALPAWQSSPALAVSLAGILFGLGSIIAALVVAGTYYAYSVSTILLILSALPAIYVPIYARQRFPGIPHSPRPETLPRFRGGAAILSSLLLFFQFGNEWSIAGWLPLFLIHHIGMSPASAIELLGVYFAALTTGRIALFFLFSRVSHRPLLAASAAAPMFGCILLAATNNRFGATIALLLIGFGFSAIYPLVSHWIGRRFPDYRPGLFNALFSIALAGGMLSPWVAGEIAAAGGINSVVTIPCAGTCIVMLLLWLIWIESRVTGQ